MASVSTPGSEPRSAAVALGFALGGFFDGILLHPMLPWHHLPSAVDVPGMADLRVRVMADGLFHAGMYLVAAVALWRLARSDARPGSRRLLGLVLVGFGAWHAVDAVLSHWLLGLHRIRMDMDMHMDTASPLAWDLAWLLAFGLLPVALGLRLAARPRSMGGPARGRGSASTAGARLHVWLAVTALAGLWAARPPAPPADGTRAATVVLRSAQEAPRLLASLDADATVVDADRQGAVWRLRLAADDSPWRLLMRGAIWVAAGPMTAGCAGWSDGAADGAPVP